jgi:hypothetical protein
MVGRFRLSGEAARRAPTPKVVRMQSKPKAKVSASGSANRSNQLAAQLIPLDDDDEALRDF